MTTLMNPGVVSWLPPAWRPAEFVPRQIIRWLEGTAGAEGTLTGRQERAAAAVAHVGYGATMGILYGLALGRQRRIAAPAAGALWGVLVWAAGYEGWLPAAGVRPATTEHPPRKWPVPIANHLLYGISTALVFEKLRSLLSAAAGGDDPTTWRQRNKAPCGRCPVYRSWSRYSPAPPYPSRPRRP